MTGGVCLLGFSRGKDSIAAWLWLRNFFDRIIPFHLAPIPHLGFVDESLEYYERFFSTPIERFLSPLTALALAQLVYQPPDDEEEIDALPFRRYTVHEVCALLRQKYNVPNAWCAYGIGMYDSISRRAAIKRNRGRVGTQHSFYPCFDWEKSAILRIIDHYKVKLPDDYLLAPRTLADVPGLRHLEYIDKVFPNDMRRIENFFPFIRTALMRNEYRREHMKAESVRAAGETKQIAAQ